MTRALHVPADLSLPATIVDLTVVAAAALLGAQAIETSGLPHCTGMQIIVDLDGPANRRQVNQRATAVWQQLHRSGPPSALRTTTLHGDVLFTGRDSSTDLPASLEELTRRMFDTVDAGRDIVATINLSRDDIDGQLVDHGCEPADLDSWLGRNTHHIEAAMLRAGNAAIGTLADMDAA